MIRGQEQPSHVRVTGKTDPHQVIRLTLMKLSSSPDIRYCINGRISFIDFYLNHQYMSVLRRRQMIHHCKMCFPVDGCQSKQIIHLQIRFFP